MEQAAEAAAKAAAALLGTLLLPAIEDAELTDMAAADDFGGASSGKRITALCRWLEKQGMRMRKDPSRRLQLEIQFLWSSSLHQPSKAGVVVAVAHNLAGRAMHIIFWPRALTRSGGRSLPCNSATCNRQARPPVA